MPPNACEFYDNVASGGIGLTGTPYVPPFANLISSHNRRSTNTENSPPPQSQPQAPAPGQCQTSPPPSSPEYQIVSIEKRKNVKGVWYWYTKYSDGSKSWQPKQSFIDNDEQGQVVNDIWQQYEKLHPYRKRKRKRSS